MKIIYSPQFLREYRSLPLDLKKKAEFKEKVFRKNPFDKRLKTHKLGGKLADFWSFSIDYRYRIIFEFKDEKTIIFHIIGDHSIYRKI
ncbi:MAG: type II toxin-antitoxin system mRNA interferase toxin, RelE/StbE family [Candidatus Nealsonbacteria bacterium]|nr:type II toxin-antitoxin system mRNA interferase toxin, RelE/StbE family [Candidatus Nealsonbacteria bacterium]